MNTQLLNKLVRLSDGNPGAASALAQILQLTGTETIDKIEAAGVRGWKIWILFKDICDQNPLAVSLLVETCPPEILLDACSREDGSSVEVIRSWRPNHASINQS